MSRQCRYSGDCLRILMFSTYFPPQYSGAAKQALSLAGRLRQRGHEIEFVTVRWPGLPVRDQVDGFKVWRLDQGHGEKHTELRLWWNLLRFVLQHRGKVDILHSHGAYYRNSVVGPLARAVGAKSLVKASLAKDDLAGLGQGLAGRLHGWMLGQVDTCVAISRDLADEFVTGGVSASCVEQISNGVDTERFRLVQGAEERVVLRQELGLPCDRPVFLAVGVFDRRKNLGWLMERWAQSQGFGTGGFLATVGPRSREDLDGSFLGGLDALAAANPELMVRADPVADIERYYRAADAFVLPSHSEGLPNVILEAMASGLPCVASVVSGTRELVDDGVTGRTFTPGDAEALGEALRGVLPPAGNDMGRRARREAECRFSLDAVADRYELLYHRLLGLEISEAGHA